MSTTSQHMLQIKQASNHLVLKLHKFLLIPLITSMFLLLMLSIHFKSTRSDGQVQGLSSALLPPSTLVTPAPQMIMMKSLPNYTARSIAVANAHTGKLVASKQASLPVLPASTTKLMTALIALNQYQLSDVIQITNAHQSIGNVADLQAGAWYLVEDLLKALLVSSGNDAALALANAYPGGYQQFLVAMNEQAALLGMTNSSFTNVSGVESPAHFMSAQDLTILSFHLISKYPLVREIVAQSSVTITDLDGQVTHVLETTNQLLGRVDGVVGLKTGWTRGAGECLVTLVNRDGVELIIVVLGSQDRFGESSKLIDWAFDQYIVVGDKDVQPSLSLKI